MSIHGHLINIHACDWLRNTGLVLVRLQKAINPTFAGFQNSARVLGMGHYDPSMISCKNEATEEFEVSKYVVLE